MNSNLGSSSLRKKRRANDPMKAFDSLPEPLRRWLAQAALPWSPVSAQRIWAKYCGRGLSEQEVTAALDRAEAKMLERDRQSIKV